LGCKERNKVRGDFFEKFRELFWRDRLLRVLLFLLIALDSSALFFAFILDSPKLTELCFVTVCFPIVFSILLQRVDTPIGRQHRLLHSFDLHRESTLQSDSRPKEGDTLRPPEFPRSWEIFGHLMTRTVRETVFEPTLAELMEEFQLAIPKARTRAGLRVLMVIFHLRISYMYAQTAWSCWGDRVRRILEFLGLAALAEIVQKFLH
jgi:hypothetical protein